jgi:formylglycine-generating enzyme required for sulfatase activity
MLWEWTHTRYDPYPYEEGDNEYNNGDVSNRVLRGGSFNNPAYGLRSADRLNWDPADLQP